MFPHHHAVASALLGGVKRVVGPVDEVLDGAGRRRPLGEPDAGGDVGAVVEPVARGVADGLPYGLGQGAALLVVQTDHEAKFLAAVAADQIRRSRRGLEDVGDAHDYLVALGVAVFVVDALEEVDVDHQAGERCPRRHGLVEDGGEAIEEGTAVEAARKRVVIGEVLQLAVALADFLLGFLQLADGEQQVVVLAFEGGDVVEGDDGAGLRRPCRR